MRQNLCGVCVGGRGCLGYLETLTANSTCEHVSGILQVFLSILNLFPKRNEMEHVKVDRPPFFKGILATPAKANPPKK